MRRPTDEIVIHSPQNGDTVSGIVTISGTTQGMGRVWVSIDGGTFEVANGVNSWTYDWNTTGLQNGLHTITARARATPSDPFFFDSMDVDVQNGGGGPDIAIESPANGDVLWNTVVVSGTSSGATNVSVQIDMKHSSRQMESIVGVLLLTPPL